MQRRKRSQITPEVFTLFTKVYQEEVRKSKQKKEVFLSEVDRERLMKPVRNPWRDKLYWIEGVQFKNPFKKQAV